MQHSNHDIGRLDTLRHYGVMVARSRRQQPPTDNMNVVSKRNLMWFGAVVTVGGVVTIIANIWWGLVAAGLVLVASEVVERTARNKRRAAAGQPKASLRDLRPTRRKP